MSTDEMIAKLTKKAMNKPKAAKPQEYAEVLNMAQQFSISKSLSPGDTLVSKKHVYETFIKWCKGNNKKSLSSQKFFLEFNKSFTLEGPSNNKHYKFQEGSFDTTKDVHLKRKKDEKN